MSTCGGFEINDYDASGPVPDALFTSEDSLAWRSMPENIICDPGLKQIPLYATLSFDPAVRAVLSLGQVGIMEMHSDGIIEKESKMSKPFQTIDHTADIGIRAFGEDLPEAFANAAKGMFSLITDLRKVRAEITFDLEVSAPQQSALLVEWLNELLYRFEVEHLLFRRFIISDLGATGLKAVAFGEKIDLRRHQLKRDIKAATYHGLKIESGQRGYQIEVILDI